MIKIGHKHFPLLYYEALLQEMAQTKKSEAFFLPDLTEHLYRHYTEIQDPVLHLSRLYVEQLSEALLNEEGKLPLENLNRVLDIVKETRFHLAPSFEDLQVFVDHALNVLICLEKEPELRKRLEKIQKPFTEKKSRELIYRTLGISNQEALSDRHTRKAVLICLLTLLRQSVGSCFATAPAILIQKEQILQLLNDLDELLATGKLSRLIDGVEYTVPMSPSSGVGDLKRPFQCGDGGVKAWYQPSLIKISKRLGFLPQSTSFLHSAAWLQTRIQKMASFSSTLTFEKIIKNLIVEDLGLESFDWEKASQSLVSNSLLPQNVMAHISRKSSDSMNLKKEVNAWDYYAIAKELFIREVEVPLLKTWEFTLASFAECKPKFSHWNMYHAMGIDSKEPGGLGHLIFQELSAIVEEINEELSRLQLDLESKYAQAKGVEGRLPETEEEMRWLKARQSSVSSEFYYLQDKLKNLQANGQRVSELYPYLVEKYMSLVPHYFQEIYDADMNEVSASLYDDRPAGFRLLYKYGRNQSYLWSLIYSQEAYQEALTNFFRQVELDLLADEHLKGLEKVVQHLQSSLESYIRNDVFVQSSTHRLQKAHRQQQSETSPTHRTPWSYVSGGSMHDLLGVYYNREPERVSKQLSSPEALFIFIVETLRQVPEKERINERGELCSFLMHSPTHAFSLYPQGLSDFLKDEVDIYNCLREYKASCQSKLRLIGFDNRKAEFIFAKVCQQLSLNYFDLSKLSIGSWKAFKHVFSKEQAFSNPAFQEQIDCACLQLFPLVEVSELSALMEDFLLEQSSLSLNRVKKEVQNLIAKEFESHYLPASYLKTLLQLLLIQVHKKPQFSKDFSKEVNAYIYQQHLAMPSPLLFADTNWCHNYFALLYNPFTEKLEFWRVGQRGEVKGPMHQWNQYLQGNALSEWGIYPKPHQYRLTIC